MSKTPDLENYKFDTSDYVKSPGLHPCAHVFAELERVSAQRDAFLELLEKALTDYGNDGNLNKPFWLQEWIDIAQIAIFHARKTTHRDIDAALYAWHVGEISLGRLKECIKAIESGGFYVLPPMGENSPQPDNGESV